MIADMLRVLGLSILVLGSAGLLAAAAPAADGGDGTSAHAGHVMAPAPVEQPASAHAGHTVAPATTPTTGGGHDDHAAATPADDHAAPAAHEDEAAGHDPASSHDPGRVAATPSLETRQAVVAGFVLVNAAIMLTALAIGLRHPRRRRRLA
jgi:hypothetical protein